MTPVTPPAKTEPDNFALGKLAGTETQLLEKNSEIQANLLSAAIELATGGSAQPHVGTGGEGSTSELPWRDKDMNFNKRTTIKRH